MRLPKRKKISRKKLAFIIGTTLLVMAIAAGMYIKTYGWPEWGVQKTKVGEVNYDKPTNDQRKSGEDIKNESINQTKPSGSTDKSPEPVPQSNGKSTVNITITAANQNGNLLQVRTLIAHVSSSGACSLTLTKGSQTVTKTAAVQALASTSTCQGFDIAVSELSPGEWDLSVSFENADATATTTRKVSIQ